MLKLYIPCLKSRYSLVIHDIFTAFINKTNMYTTGKHRLNLTLFFFRSNIIDYRDEDQVSV